MFISKRRLTLMIRTIESLERKIARLDSDRISARLKIDELRNDVNGDFTLSMFPNPGVKNNIKYLKEKVTTHQNNFKLLMEHLSLQFVDLEAERTIIEDEEVW